MEAQNQNQNHVEEEHALLPAAKLARFTEPLVSSTLSGAVGMAPPIGLGLALGIGLGQSAFTFLQLQELEHQALILKYMVAGLPVPFHLVLPIWKSVVSSHGGVFQRHPIMLGCGNLCFDYRNNMEPEPGRCRRTDGKKWRCSKDVVPDQKYCERHMHRGRHRSRKLVEAHNTTPIIDSNIHLSISIPTGLNLNNNNSNHSSNSDKSSWNNNNGGCIASPPRLEFSPTSVFQKGYGSISETSSNSTSKTESALCFD